MVSRQGEKWSREETILAYDLYCRIPFAKIHKSNKDIIALAELIGRTPSSVGLKMANLAHFDPELRSRNVSGMSNASKLDKEIFEEFASDWEELSYQAQLIKADYSGKTISDLNDEFVINIEMLPEGTDALTETKRRVGQYFFRTSVLAAYGNKCCVTGLKAPELLIASHIKPWKVSDAKTERTNPKNGLCLNALHDKAFDRGLITVDDKYRIVVSNRLKEIPMDEETQNWILYYDGQEISRPEKFVPDKDFLHYHNDVVFVR